MPETMLFRRKALVIGATADAGRPGKASITRGTGSQGKGSRGYGSHRASAFQRPVLLLTFSPPQSRLRYLQADFLNLQRNAAREKEQQRDYAITRFASDLLETVDVLGLALKSIPPEAFSETAPPNPSSSSSKTHRQYLQELHTGVEITNRQLLQTLFKYHVKPFDPTGEIFDPNRHEAMYQVPVQGKEPGTVLHCQKIGYMIKDRVLRAAQVGVVQDTS